MDTVASNPQSAIRNHVTADSDPGPQSEDRLWRMRDAVIAWRLWQREGKAYAVEIHSHVKQRIEGQLREKLANTQVFFLHGLAEEGEIR